MIKDLWNKKPDWLTYSNISSTTSLIWRWVQRFFIWSSKYASGVLATTAIGASVVATGYSLDTSAQLKTAQSEIVNNNIQLIQTIQIAKEAKDGLDKSSDMLKAAEDKVAELQTQQQTLEDKANNSNSQINSSIDAQQQNLTLVQAKTIKAEADLHEVQGKIDDANVKLKDTSDTIIVLDDKSKKTIEEIDTATKDLLTIKSQLEDEIKTVKDLIATNQLSNQNALEGLSSSISDTDSRLNKAISDTKILTDSIVTDITQIKTENDSQNSSISSESSQISSQGSIISGLSDTLNTKITDYDNHFATHDINVDVLFQNYDGQNNQVVKMQSWTKSGKFDPQNVANGTFHFPAYSSRPIVIASICDGSGLLNVYNVTNGSADYYANGYTSGFKICWIAFSSF